MEVTGQLHALAAVPLEKSSDTHWIGGWMGTVASLDVMEKRKISYPCQDSNPDIWTVCILSRLSTGHAKRTKSKSDVSYGGSIQIGTGPVIKVCTYFLFEETIFCIYLARWFVLRVNQEMLQINNCDFQRTKHCNSVNKMFYCCRLPYTECKSVATPCWLLRHC